MWRQASEREAGDAAVVAQRSVRARDSTSEDVNLQADGWRKYPKSRLLASSAGRGWSTISAELRFHPAGIITSPVQQNMEVVIAISGDDEGRVIRNGAGRQEETRSAPGTIWLAPVGIGGEEIMITAAIPKALHLYLPVGQFDLLANQYNLARSPAHSIQYVGGLMDNLIYEIGETVLSELKEQTATGRMFAETSSLILAARLAHNYGGSTFIDLGGAGARRLDSARLRRVVDYIEHHLEEQISVERLAEVAHLSTFHFTRVFAATFGVPPHRYVSRRRLEKAMAMLAVGTLPLSVIAHKSCFSSQAAFSRAFRRVTGLTPGEYRRHIR